MSPTEYTAVQARRAGLPMSSWNSSAILEGDGCRPYMIEKTSVYHTVNGDPAHCFTHRKPQNDKGYIT